MSQVVINNIVWSNVSVTFLNNIWDLTTKISYKRTGNHKPNYAAGQEPVGYGRGNYTYTASIEMYQEQWEEIYALTAGNPQALNIGNIAITVLPTLESLVSPFTDTLYNCVFLEDDLSTSQGDTKIMITIPLMISGFSRFE